MNGSIDSANPPPADHSKRTFAIAAAFGLLVMAVLAPIAQFGVLATLLVPTDASATATNIAGSLVSFQAAIGAFFIVAILDVVVAFALYVLLRSVNRTLALAVGWLRVVYAAIFVVALLNLWNVAQILGSATASTVSDSATAQVTTSIASFHTVWDLGLVVFGVHLVGLGALLVRSASFGRIIGALVVVSGAGYLVDSIGRLAIPGYDLTLSMFTFVGEALLIVWLFRLAIRGSRASDSAAAVEVPEVAASAAT